MAPVPPPPPWVRHWLCCNHVATLRALAAPCSVWFFWLGSFYRNMIVFDLSFSETTVSDHPDQFFTLQ